MPKTIIRLIPLDNVAGDLDAINTLLAEASESDKATEAYSGLSELDSVPIDIPDPAANRVNTHYVHPDVKALIDELIQSIDNSNNRLTSDAALGLVLSDPRLNVTVRSRI